MVGFLFTVTKRTPGFELTVIRVPSSIDIKKTCFLHSLNCGKNRFFLAEIRIIN